MFKAKKLLYVMVTVVLLIATRANSATISDLSDLIYDNNIQAAKHLLLNDEQVRRNINTSYYHNEGTILHHVASQGLVDLVEPLLDAGASPDVTNRYGNSPLKEAFNHRKMDVIDILLRRFPGLINQPHAKANATLLHFAIAEGDEHLEIVKLLVEKYNALITQNDIAFARRRGFTAILRYLETEMPRQQARIAQTQNITTVALEGIRNMTQNTGLLGRITGLLGLGGSR